MAYNFKDRSIAYELKRIANEGMNQVADPRLQTGDEVIFVKNGSEPIPAKSESGEISSGECTRMYANPNDDGTLTVTEHAEMAFDVFNPFGEEIEPDEEFNAARIGIVWVKIGGGGSVPSETVQFRLKAGWLGTGISSAVTLTTVGESPAGSEIIVNDYKKLFQNAIGSDEQNDLNGGSIGWATKIGEEWLVTQCTQKVNRYEATVANGICTGTWGESIAVTNPIARSVWPYTDADPSISNTGDFNAINVHGLSANGGKVWVEFHQDPTVDQDPTNSTVPYTATAPPTSGHWVITDIENPIATYIQVSWNGSIWEVSGSTKVYDGLEPDAEYNTTVSIPADLNVLGGATPSGECLAVGTKGLAAIDRANSTGSNLRYIVVSTSSSLNGEAHEAAIVGTLSPTDSSPADNNTITVDGCEVKYQQISRTYLFGDPVGTDSCEMTEEEITEPFINWSDQEIITTVSVNGSGELEMGKATVSVCSSTAETPDTIGLQSMDVVNDVYCSGDSLAKNYKTIKFLGSVDSSSNGVAIDTSCIEIDYTQIIYPEYPYIDYYDIIWPTGCDPCQDPLGCCTATAYPSGQDGITQSSCEAETGYISWTEGSCSGATCESSIIEWFSIEMESGACTAYFTQNNTDTVSGGSATINGTWEVFNGTTHTDFLVPGTATLTNNGTTWSISAVVPSYGGGTTVTADNINDINCSGAGGNIGGPSGGSPCGDPWNGTFYFDASQ